jgi:hypothetical protein
MPTLTQLVDEVAAEVKAQIAQGKIDPIKSKRIMDIIKPIIDELDDGKVEPTTQAEEEPLSVEDDPFVKLEDPIEQQWNEDPEWDKK